MDDGFEEFAAAYGARLRRTAFLLAGDWHTAADLAQTTLTKMFLAWRRVGRDAGVYAYAQRVLINSYLATKRRRASSELTLGEMPDTPTPVDDTALRVALLGALGTLPPRVRAVLILRFWEDLPVAEVATLLGCAEGTVKSQTARGLDRLRVLLGDSLFETC